MGVSDIIKAKVPAFPKEIDDKNLATQFKKWEKAYADLQAAAAEFGQSIGQASPNFGIITTECLKKLKDKNLDPKQAKAYQGLYDAVSKLESLVAKV